MASYPSGHWVAVRDHTHMMSKKVLGSTTPSPLGVDVPKHIMYHSKQPKNIFELPKHLFLPYLIGRGHTNGRTQHQDTQQCQLAYSGQVEYVPSYSRVQETLSQPQCPHRSRRRHKHLGSQTMRVNQRMDWAKYFLHHVHHGSSSHGTCATGVRSCSHNGHCPRIGQLLYSGYHPGCGLACIYMSRNPECK